MEPNQRMTHIWWFLLFLSFFSAQTAFGNKHTFVYIAGIEGTGHHAALPILTVISKHVGFYKIKHDDQPFQSCTWKIHKPHRLQEHMGRIIETDRSLDGVSVLVEFTSFPFRNVARDGDLDVIKADNHYNIEWVIQTVNGTEFKPKVLHITRDFVHVVKSHAELDGSLENHAIVMATYQKHLFLEYKRSEPIIGNLWKTINVFELFSDPTNCPAAVTGIVKFLEWTISPEKLTECCAEIQTVWRQPKPRVTTDYERNMINSHDTLAYAWPYLFPPKTPHTGTPITEISQVLALEPVKVVPAPPAPTPDITTTTSSSHAVAPVVTTTTAAAAVSAVSTVPTTVTLGASSSTPLSSPSHEVLVKLLSSEPLAASVESEIWKVYATHHSARRPHSNSGGMGGGGASDGVSTGVGGGGPSRDRYFAVEEIYIPAWNVAYNKHNGALNVLIHPPAARYTAPVQAQTAGGGSGGSLSFSDRSADRAPKKVGSKVIDGGDLDKLRALLLDRIRYEASAAAFLDATGA